MSATPFSRTLAILFKELIQVRRDRMTFGMMMGVPIMQLVLFGFAINSDPKHLPAIVLMQDHSAYTRSYVAALENSGYFEIDGSVATEAEAKYLMEAGDVDFIVTIPPDFTHKLLRQETPTILLEADATDPTAVGNAVAAATQLANTSFTRELCGYSGQHTGGPPFEVRVHRRFNPEGKTQYNIIPGLIGVILTMSTIMMTSMALTREVERGTMENLLAMPVTPLEVMMGKILPYILIGFFQVGIIVCAAYYLFSVPVIGPMWVLFFSVFCFIAANVAVGYTFSTISRNQMQAMQMTTFYFLPSMLLSGFLFPFRGMPEWAQMLGNTLPLKHFLIIARGVILKGNGWAETWPNLVPILVFFLTVTGIAVTRYRKTLD
ncbi:MAG: ABC transporter permease [Alphaproteobacteria bacterium]|nr:ABC transporter permease [Alphaproteobacteria bacterium]